MLADFLSTQSWSILNHVKRKLKIIKKVFRKNNPRESLIIMILQQGCKIKYAQILAYLHQQKLPLYRYSIRHFSIYTYNALFLDWQFSAYIGARKKNDQWIWHGRVTGSLTYDWWGNNQSSGKNKNCLNVGASIDYKFNDLVCVNQNYFYCERVRNS